MRLIPLQHTDRPARNHRAVNSAPTQRRVRDTRRQRCHLCGSQTPGDRATSTGSALASPKMLDGNVPNLPATVAQIAGMWP